MYAYKDAWVLGTAFNGIAYPVEDVASYTRKRGLEVEFQECCCSFVFETAGSV